MTSGPCVTKKLPMVGGHPRAPSALGSVSGGSFDLKFHLGHGHRTGDGHLLAAPWSTRLLSQDFLPDGGLLSAVTSCVTSGKVTHAARRVLLCRTGTGLGTPPRWL